MPGTATFIMQSGAQIVVHAKDLKYGITNGRLDSYEIIGFGKPQAMPVYIRVANIDAIIWAPDEDEGTDRLHNETRAADAATQE